MEIEPKALLKHLQEELKEKAKHLEQLLFKYHNFWYNKVSKIK